MKNRGDVFDKKQTLTGTKAFPQSGEGGAQRRMRVQASSSYRCALISHLR